jgi:NodT family efflux transporter outer membrane factor (OMF) lipoprotein
MQRRLPSPHLTILLAFSLAGCAVGPDFQRPAAPSATAYLPPAEAAGVASKPSGPLATTSGEAPLRWWTAYGSPALDDLVDRAIANNRSLEASNATLARSRAELAAARGTALPQVDVNSRAEREEVNLSGFGFKAGTLPGFSSNPEFNLYTVGGGVSYDLDLFGGRKRRIEQAGAQAEAELRQAQAAHLSIAGQVVVQVIRIAAIRSRIEAAQTLIAEDQRNVDLTDQRRRGGEGTMVQVLNARSQMVADQASLPQLHQSLSEAQHLLATLVGVAPSQFTAPDLDLEGLALPADVPVALPSALVHRRPDILQAEANLHAATAAIGVATARLYPDVTLGATLTQAAPSGGDVLKNAFRGYDLFAGLTAPVFHGGTLKAQRQAAVDDARAASATYQATVLAAFGQVADLLQALAHDQQAVDAQQQALRITGSSLDLSRRSFQAGNSGVLDILDAERIHQRSLSGLVEARAQQLLDSARLFVATAGGWTGVPPREVTAGDQGIGEVKTSRR